MGGYEGGQEASRIAIEAIEEIYGSIPDGDPQGWLLAGFYAAHLRILQYADEHPELQDRKSTRLNSSHDQISYAVFCLKKKKQQYVVIDPLGIYRTARSMLSSMSSRTRG